MKPVSESELVELGEAFNVTLYESELADVCEFVNEMLDDIDKIDDVPVDRPANGDTHGRTWTDSPDAACSVTCDVPPPADHSGALEAFTVGVKDNIALAGIPLQCGSEVLRGFCPQTDATVVRRLRASGAMITMKTTLDEFAGAPHGVTGTDGAVCNPHDRERLAGGSSAGSGVAVATDQVRAALGTDTGGSIRIPAAWCGITGLKPTYGLVPLTGVVENTYTLDHVGPLTKTVADAGRVLTAIAGTDPRDPASLQAAGREAYTLPTWDPDSRSTPSVSSLTIGVLAEGIGDGVESTVADRFAETIDNLSNMGASVRDVSSEYFQYGKAVKNCISAVEMATHWRAGGAPYRRGGIVDDGYQAGLARRGAATSAELHPFYKSKLLSGAHLVDRLNGRHYTRAHAARQTIREEFEQLLDDVDCLLLPTMPDVPPRVENAFETTIDYARNTRIANVTGFPAITIPHTLEDPDCLPTGLQLVAGPYDDQRLLEVAHTVESAITDRSDENKTA